MCSDIWFLPKSKVQTGSHYYTPCCTFTHKCHCASAGPCSPVAEPERPNMRQRFLRRSPPPPFADPRFLLHHALWAVTPSLHPDHRSHTRAAFHPRSCWEDVSVWLKALWEISTTRPSLEAMKKAQERASEGCVPHCSIRRLLDGYKTSLAQIKTNQGRVHYAILI